MHLEIASNSLPQDAIEELNPFCYSFKIPFGIDMIETLLSTFPLVDFRRIQGAVGASPEDNFNNLQLSALSRFSSSREWPASISAQESTFATVPGVAAAVGVVPVLSSEVESVTGATGPSVVASSWSIGSFNWLKLPLQMDLLVLYPINEELHKTDLVPIVVVEGAAVSFDPSPLSE